MANALDVAKSALALWRRYRGNESTYLQCQRYDGWYWQAAYQGNESVISYPSAIAAARASNIFTKNVNDSSIVPGDQIFWNWGQYGHVATVIGRDGHRVLVTHTSNSGDNLLYLGLSVRVSHADTISLDVYGVSHANGKNRQRTGLSPWSIGSPAPNPGGSTGGNSSSGQKIDLREGWAWYNSASDAENQRNPHGPKWTGEQLARGVYPVIQAPNAIQIRANDGSAIWISPSARSKISGSTPAPTPQPAAKKRYVKLDTNWYYYNSRDEALSARNGKKWVSPGTHLIVDGSGPFLIYVGALGRNVWVGSSRTNPPVVYI